MVEGFYCKFIYGDCRVWKQKFCTRSDISLYYIGLLFGKVSPQVFHFDNHVYIYIYIYMMMYVFFTYFYMFCFFSLFIHKFLYLCNILFLLHTKMPWRVLFKVFQNEWLSKSIMPQTLFYFCFTLRCLDEFCLKCFRKTSCQNLSCHELSSCKVFQEFVLGLDFIVLNK